MLETEGAYRCEVSNEFPDFDTVGRAQLLRVVAIPTGPRISGAPAAARPGDRIQLNCSLAGSLPAPTIHWYINKTPVNSDMVEQSSLSNPDTTVDLVSSLTATLSDTHFRVYT